MSRSVPNFVIESAEILLQGAEQGDRGTVSLLVDSLTGTPFKQNISTQDINILAHHNDVTTKKQGSS